MPESSPGRSRINPIRRGIISFACGLAAIGGSVEYLKALRPPTPAQIEACAKAIGKRALYNDQLPSQCEKFSEYFPPRAIGVDPATATIFRAEANDVNSQQGSNEVAEEILIMFISGGVAYAGARFYDFLAGESHQEESNSS